MCIHYSPVTIIAIKTRGGSATSRIGYYNVTREREMEDAFVRTRVCAQRAWRPKLSVSG